MWDSDSYPPSRLGGWARSRLRAAFAFLEGRLTTTNIYIDGFNLFYGALRKTPYRWLDIEKLCGFLLPGHTIGQIKYFTAKVSARPDDLDQPVRQQLYLRALGTLPKVSVHLGHFLTHKVRMPLAGPAGQPLQYVQVIKTEEKGSDVNLATHLLHDAHLGRFDVAVIVSNDSDLLGPVRIVREELGKTVGALNPHQNPSRAMLPHLDFYKPIRKGVLQASQFPDTLSDQHGTFTKPAAW